MLRNLSLTNHYKGQWLLGSQHNLLLRHVWWNTMVAVKICNCGVQLLSCSTGNNNYRRCILATTTIIVHFTSLQQPLEWSATSSTQLLMLTLTIYIHFKYTQKGWTAQHMRYNGRVSKLPPYFAVFTFLCSSNMQKSCVTVLHNVTTYMQWYIRSPPHTITLKHEGQLAPFLFNHAFNLCSFWYSKKKKNIKFSPQILRPLKRAERKRINRQICMFSPYVINQFSVLILS